MARSLFARPKHIAERLARQHHPLPRSQPRYDSNLRYYNLKLNRLPASAANQQAEIA
jgi:hypothetical protein